MQTLNAETRQWVSAIGLRDQYPLIEWVRDLCEDAAAVRTGSLWGFVDRNGCWIAEPQYSCVSDFSDGLALVERELSDPVCEPASLLDSFINNNVKSYIDRTGRVVLELPDNVESPDDFHEGLARAYRTGSGWGYIDKTGHWVIESHGDWTGYDFHEGYAMILCNGKCGFIDKTGRIVIPPKYKDAEQFNGGVARVKVGTIWRHIDTHGNFIKKPSK